MQALQKLFSRDTDLLTPHFVRLACLSGLANAAVLAVVNMSVQTSTAGGTGLLYGLVLFGLAIVIYAKSQKRLMVDTSERIERLISSLRLRLLDAVQASEFHEVERIGRAEIFGNLSRETQVLSQSAPNLIVAVQQAVLLVCTMTYMFFLSKLAFLLLAAVTAAGAALHLVRAKQVRIHLEEASRNDDELIEGFSDAIDGFREVKLNHARARGLSGAIRTTSSRSYDSRTLVHTSNANDFVLSQVTFFILTGMMVFVVPAFGQIDSATVGKVTTATLFMLGPVGALVGSFPVFNNANVSAGRILDLEEKLLSGRALVESFEGLDAFSDFKEIVLNGVGFAYPSDAGDGTFAVGPNSMHIKRGECIFITGGNGSGKTTLLNLLLTIIPAQSGTICVDGVKLLPEDLPAYRNLFSAVFSDNHLFKTLHGTAPFTSREAHSLLEAMEISEKVSIEDMRYSNTNVSGGQRKRIAMVTSQLEKKPILVLDEWAADQDPLFRRKFYREVIPALRAQGLTIIAITHDDRYFDVADARYHMEEGQLERVA